MISVTQGCIQKFIFLLIGMATLGLQKLEARTSCAVGIVQEHFEVLHPALYFTAVQKACLELGTDLDVVKSNLELQNLWINKSDYLIEQFLKLYTSVANLISNKKEARSYLLEDAFFLIELIELVNKKYEQLILNIGQVNLNVLECLTILMEKSKQKMYEVLKFNLEALKVEVELSGFLKIPRKINSNLPHYA